MLNTGCPGLILYGRRRMGKSTLLRNLDGFLPKAVRVITFSMQEARAFNSMQSFLDLIIKALLVIWPGQDQPAVIEPDLTHFSEFLSIFNARLVNEGEGQRVLIALDEYENLDRKLGQGVFSEDLLAVIRESIQSHRRLTWIFAGSHAISELQHAPWSSYLVSARTLEVPPFSEAETCLLLTQPLKYSPLWQEDDPERPHFDPVFWGEDGIEWIHAQAGGWPHLIQLLAEVTVDLCNDREQAQVDKTLLEQAANEAIVLGDTVLQQLLKEESTPLEWAYLRGFRTRDTQPPPEDEAVYQALRRRLLVVPVNSEWRLRVPLMQRWLRERG